MKIIEYYASAQNVTHLPPEVIEIVIQHVRTHRSPRAIQRDLWSCCLIAQDWYSTTIKYLYEAPLLLPKNFSEFARTLSPPMSSKVRRVGLEDFVQHLDMGLLAYESQKSTTSRLLSRTKSTLRTFTAPAVSFSTTSLAPLSKCANLRHLDLSRDQYDFGLNKLLHSLQNLSHLSWLSLPKDCPLLSDRLDQLTKSSWPPSLMSLHFNTSKEGAFLYSSSNLIAHLPERLEELAFANCVSYAFLATLEPDVCPQVTRLCVRVNRCDGTFNFNSIVKPFPQVTNLTIPAMTQWLFMNFAYSAAGDSWSLTATPEDLTVAHDLEVLVLEESPDFPYSDHISMNDMSPFIEKCPRLLRIEVPVAYLNVDDAYGGEIDEVNNTLSQRFKGLVTQPSSFLKIDEVGLFVTEPRLDAGVGLKRSFRYDAND